VIQSDAKGVQLMEHETVTSIWKLAMHDVSNASANQDALSS
jgi:hypothetical protein